MSTERPETPRHLSSLCIRNFLGIESLALSCLGQVTLLAGKNSVGKTTILNAVQVYAARGRHTEFGRILRDREELRVVIDENGADSLEPDWSALFYGRRIIRDRRISIGPKGAGAQLTVEPTALSEAQFAHLEERLPSELWGYSWQGLQTTFGTRLQIIPYVVASDEAGEDPHAQAEWYRLNCRNGFPRSREETPLSRIKSIFSGPDLSANDELIRYWNQSAAAGEENQAVKALNLIFGDDIENIVLVGSDSARGRNEDRVYLKRRGGADRFLVKLKSHAKRRIPLRSLGDGALRLFGLAFALANSQGGFLLLDAVENGLHYSIQQAFWSMILRMAREYNVQVLATTHSSDCINGFAYAADENKDIEGRLIRLDRDEYGLHAIEYSEENLKIAAEHALELR